MSRDVHPLPGYPEPYGLLAAILQDGTREWRQELPDELPPEAMVWQPHPGLHSIGGIMLHIMHIEVVWMERYVLRLPCDEAERSFLMARETDVDEWQWPVPHHQPLSWYYARHDEIRTRTLRGLHQWPEPDFLHSDDPDPLTPRWVLGHLVQHEAYHGGQAVLLHRLRLLA